MDSLLLLGLEVGGLAAPRLRWPLYVAMLLHILLVEPLAAVPPAGPVAITHHIPGRLRLALAGLKRHPRIALAVERKLERLPGVLSVSASPWTGRVLIRYDPVITSAAWLAIQVEMGWVRAEATAP
jgi:hypothetical protein